MLHILLYIILLLYMYILVWFGTCSYKFVSANALSICLLNIQQICYSVFPLYIFLFDRNFLMDVYHVCVHTILHQSIFFIIFIVFILSNGSTTPEAGRTTSNTTDTKLKFKWKQPDLQTTVPKKRRTVFHSSTTGHETNDAAIRALSPPTNTTINTQKDDSPNFDELIHQITVKITSEIQSQVRDTVQEALQH